MFSPCGKNSSSHIQTSTQTGLTRGFQEQYIPHQQAKKAKSPSRLKNKFPCWLRLQRVWSWSELKPHTCCTWTTTSELSSTQLVKKCLYANQVYTLSSEKKKQVINNHSLDFKCVISIIYWGNWGSEASITWNKTPLQRLCTHTVF